MEDTTRGLGDAPLTPGWTPPAIDTIDTTKAHPARIYDCLLGGKDHFEVDRQAAEVVLKALPGAREMVRENRAFLGRAVRHLAEAGITQFLDIGTGIPGPGNTGDVARSVRPDARVVYVDYDPVVAVHSRALLAGADPELTAIVVADVRNPKSILDSPAVGEVLDFDKPIAVLMVALLHFIKPEEDAHGIVATFRDALPPGSAVVISHGTDGGDPETSAEARKGWDNATSQFTVRDRDDITALFDGFELVEPGVVNVPLWRPEGAAREDWADIWFDGGVGFKR
ncbi:SAM-dependent methyltransferase [Catenulispora rubra]|uniref:SAM-dependent methyltransferase n=1 Tax=Catenulispora rubra TaxID=280293 RepID=UPI002B27B93A|nr:SAM-dependent methyltransferase [Catenulispora rubra]